MRVLVTSGGTREPIDDVRFIANTSTGRLGARLAEALHAADHEVLVLHGEGAARPAAPIAAMAYRTSADLAALLEEHVPRMDVVIHAAAVSDFVPEPATGKLSSDRDELVLRLRRAPKLVDRLRALQPRALLVGFKLTSGLDEQQRVARARALLERADLDLVVVNDVGRVQEHDHEALLVEAQGEPTRARGKAAIARALVSAVERHHPRELSSS